MNDFKVGDSVKSAPDSSDVRNMGRTWTATVHRVVAENDSGGCYETIGKWDNAEPDAAPTLRQLWGCHLTASED